LFELDFPAEVDNDFKVRVRFTTFKDALETYLYLFNLQLYYLSIRLFVAQVF